MKNKEKISKTAIGIFNALIVDTLSKSDSNRSNIRIQNFNTEFKKLVNSNSEVKFESTIKTWVGKKKSDIIITKLNGESTYISCIFPTQSINKNKNNSLEHVISDATIALQSENTGYNITNGISVVFLPTKTLNYSKKVYKEEDVIGSFSETLNNSFVKVPYKKIEGCKQTLYVIFYEPNNNFFEAIKNKNTNSNVSYVDNIYNIDDLYSFYLDINQ